MTGKLMDESSVNSFSATNLELIHIATSNSQTSENTLVIALNRTGEEMSDVLSLE